MKISKYTLSLALMLVFFIGGCSTMGMKEVTYQDIDFYNPEDVFGCGRHINSQPFQQKEEIVINSQEEYQKMIDDAPGYFQCQWGKPPQQIDFSQKTLIGKFATGGGCSVEFNKAVYRDDDNKKILYLVNVDESGFCDMAGISMNWVTIPKLPEGYSVSFEVKK